MLDDPEKKKKSALRLVARKSTRRMLGKWKKLDSSEKSDAESIATEVKTKPARKVLGLSLQEATLLDPALDGVPLPAFYRRAVDFVEKHGLSTEGIYRLAPPKSRLDDLERRANRGDTLVFVDAHDAAGLIKRFLRQLPAAMLPYDFERVAESCKCGLHSAVTILPPIGCTCGAARTMRVMLAHLDPYHRTLFAYVFLHSQNVVKKEKENKMGIPALGLLLQTVLEMSRKLVCFAMHAVRPLHQAVPGADYILDDETNIEEYVEPMSASQIDNWLCEDPQRMKQELDKQNFMLHYLHRKISEGHEKGSETKQLDEEVWGVQSAITTLNRRLKQMGETRPVTTSYKQTSLPSDQIYLEKQLLATRGMLREDILEEKRRIAWLCWQFRECQVPIFQTDNVSERSIDDAVIEAKQRCALQEEARQKNLDEIAQLRDHCTSLRAHLEMTTQGILQSKH